MNIGIFWTVLKFAVSKQELKLKSPQVTQVRNGAISITQLGFINDYYITIRLMLMWKNHVYQWGLIIPCGQLPQAPQVRSH